MQDFALMDVESIQTGLLAKEFSAREIAENALERVAEFDKEVHAFLEVTDTQAFAAAEKIDAAIAAGSFDPKGSLQGVPVAFKDNMNLDGTHTTCSSRMLEN